MPPKCKNNFRPFWDTYWSGDGGRVLRAGGAGLTDLMSTPGPAEQSLALPVKSADKAARGENSARSTALKTDAALVSERGHSSHRKGGGSSKRGGTSARRTYVALASDRPNGGLPATVAEEGAPADAVVATGEPYGESPTASAPPTRIGGDGVAGGIGKDERAPRHSSSPPPLATATEGDTPGPPILAPIEEAGEGLARQVKSSDDVKAASAAPTTAPVAAREATAAPVKPEETSKSVADEAFVAKVMTDILASKPAVDEGLAPEPISDESLQGASRRPSTEASRRAPKEGESAGAVRRHSYSSELANDSVVTLALSAFDSLPVPLQELVEVGTFLSFVQGKHTLELSELHAAAIAVHQVKQIETVWRDTVAGEAREAALKKAFESLPKVKRDIVNQLLTLASKGELPACFQVESLAPLRLRAGDERVECALVVNVICRSSCTLPPEAACPWRWSSGWGGVLARGRQVGREFSTGLLKGSVVQGKSILNLRALIGGHRPTALRAVGAMLPSVSNVDLRDNMLTPIELGLLLSSLTAAAASLTKLNLGGNPLDAGAVGALCLGLTSADGCKLGDLDLSRTRLCAQPDDADGAAEVKLCRAISKHDLGSPPLTTRRPARLKHTSHLPPARLKHTGLQLTSTWLTFTFTFTAHWLTDLHN